ncbi:hypothetical protein [Pseudoteredinibacter isoporae]|uniref:Uncharacterized protein n=1 Tax=Pseudoteredinibacter isoporae TaxID=570281 RepID=A0A7X0MVF2_9GAMM|nr:hypothetical protein [Pseudoteredinibacter isoporae]MBB6521313.1 hypothetical protein [Pseudoteredinibacter isoporae]NHO86869.1 hypothetical protein [Pseudoteredinibacter isoporae]NIB24679.1 hypothetical protein [Pseudoteredinibacter isoporae]
MFNGNYILISITLIVSASISASNKNKLGFDNLDQANILYISSWNKDLPWQRDIESSLKSQLTKDPRDINLFTEYLDSSRFNHRNYYEEFKNYLSKKYSFKIDLVITQSDPAAIFLKSFPELLPGTKRFYVSSNSNVLPEGNDIQTLNILEDFDTSISEAIKVSGAKNIYIIGDSSEDDGDIRISNIRKSEKNIGSGVNFHYLIDVPFDELIDRVSELSNESIIYYALIYNTGDKKITPYKGAQLLSKYANRPIFSHWDSLIGSGIIGGYLISGEALGIAIYQNINAFLSSESLMSIQSDKIAKKHIYDWHQTVRWNINLNNISEGFIIRNKPPTLYEQFKVQVIGAALIFITLILLTGSLIISNTRRKVLVSELEMERASLEEKVDLRTEELKNLTGKL